MEILELQGMSDLCTNVEWEHFYITMQSQEVHYLYK